jgi:hypothetical protein
MRVHWLAICWWCGRHLIQHISRKIRVALRGLGIGSLLFIPLLLHLLLQLLLLE